MKGRRARVGLAKCMCAALRWSANHANDAELKVRRAKRRDSRLKPALKFAHVHIMELLVPDRSARLSSCALLLATSMLIKRVVHRKLPCQPLFIGQPHGGKAFGNRP